MELCLVELPEKSRLNIQMVLVVMLKLHAKCQMFVNIDCLDAVRIIVKFRG